MSNTTLINALVFNNRFATAKLNAEQLSPENFTQWKNFVDALHRTAYTVYAYCENNGLKVENASVDKAPIYNALRSILDFIGEVNEHKLYANEASAIAIIGYAGKRGYENSNALKDVLDELAFENAKLNRENKAPNGKEAYIASIEARIEELEARKTELLAQPDNRIKAPTKTSATSFRLDFERYIARVIVGQQAKSLEELDAEEAARKEARKEKAKARKAAKKAAAAANA